jgi:gas vesicle protein
MSDRDGDLGAFLSGVIIGGLIGAAAALLLAPQSGEETRAIIRERSIELKDKATETAEEARHRAEMAAMDARHRAEELAHQARERADEAIKRGQEVIDQQVDRFTKTEDDVTPPTPSI